MNTQHHKPCAECPFSRNVKPYVVDQAALGNSPPEVYIGQIEAGFSLPCHMRYDDPDDQKAAGMRAIASGGQCAGLAIFRGNLGQGEKPHPLVLPPDHERVFDSFEDFLAFHRQMPRFVAALALRGLGGPEGLAEQARRAPGVRAVVVDRATGKIAGHVSLSGIVENTREGGGKENVKNDIAPPPPKA